MMRPICTRRSGSCTWQPLEHHCIDQAEDCRVGADAERQRQDDDSGEDTVAAEHAQRVAKVLPKVLQPASAHVAALLLDGGDVAELEERATLRFLRLDAGSDVVVDQAIAMEAHLVADPRIARLSSRPMHHPGYSVVRRMLVMTAERRSQFSDCSSSCLRPTFVSV